MQPDNGISQPNNGISRPNNGVLQSINSVSQSNNGISQSINSVSQSNNGVSPSRNGGLRPDEQGWSVLKSGTRHGVARPGRRRELKRGKTDQGRLVRRAA